MALNQQGRNLLAYLVDTILPRARPGHPNTYVTYNEALRDLNLPDTLHNPGRSLQAQGLSNLAEWTRVQDRPAITGLIVREQERDPGPGYFRLYGQTPDAFPWWEDEIKKSIRANHNNEWDEPLGRVTPPPVRTVTPTAEEFAATLRSFEQHGALSDDEHSMLVCHYNSPGRKLTARAMSALMGWGGQAANAQYGALGRRLSDELNWLPEERRGVEAYYVAALVLGRDTPSGFEWTQRPEVASALEKLGWTDPRDTDSGGEELGGTEQITEQRRYRWQRQLERNSKAAALAKNHHGYKCQACTMSFQEDYGEIGHNFIEAHHLVPLSELDPTEPRVYEPRDFAVLCSNCHRMIHRWPTREAPDPSDLQGFRTIVQNRQRQ